MDRGPLLGHRHLERRATDAAGPLGLVWIDAHMDSHTPETSQSGALHCMPLAVLLGHGAPELTGLDPAGPKILRS